jgi:hypothetical protein
VIAGRTIAWLNWSRFLFEGVAHLLLLLPYIQGLNLSPAWGLWSTRHQILRPSTKINLTGCHGQATDTSGAAELVTGHCQDCLLHHVLAALSGRFSRLLRVTALCPRCCHRRRHSRLENFDRAIR